MNISKLTDLVKEVSVINLEIFCQNNVHLACLAISGQSHKLLKCNMNDYLRAREVKKLRNIHKLREEGFLRGRLASKNAIMQLINSDKIHDIEIYNGVFGHPIVNLKESSLNVKVSISHTKSLSFALAFYEDFPMALDIEEVNCVKARDVTSQLSRNEINTFAKNDKDLIKLWTIKESLSKVLKTGLMSDFSLYEVSSMREKNGYTESSFTNFPQYKAQSYLIGNIICTIVIHRKSDISFLNKKVLELW